VRPASVAALLFLIALGLPVRALAAGGDRIAFVSTAEGNADIFITDLEGRDVENLSRSPSSDTAPAWSPGNAKIAFVSDRSGRSSIWIMNGDGSGPQQLTDGTPGSSDADPTWSPDGTQIAFSRREAPDEPSAIWTIGVDGSGLTRVAEGREPSWSSDGGRVAYSGPGPGGASAILVVDLTSRAIRPLTSGEEIDRSPAWSPDGSQVAFVRAFANENAIARVAPDGSGFGFLHGGLGFESDPSWSPDGTRLVFHVDPVGAGESYLFVFTLFDPFGDPVFTGNPIQPVDASNSSPAWAPLRTPLVFLHEPDDGQRVQRGSTLFASYSCHSGDAAVVSCTGDVPNGAAIETGSYGSGRFTVTAVDALGNRTTVTNTFVVTDLTPPSIVIRAPAPNDRYLVGELVATDFSCADDPDGFGLLSCDGDPWLDTARVGFNSFIVRASDRAGNQSMGVQPYQVVYDWSGFAAPVANPPTLNVFKAGQGIPLRFSLGGDHGLAVIRDGAPVSRQIPCNSVEFATSGAPTTGKLSYKPDRYTYLWETDRSWAGTCRQLALVLVDGTENFANFQLKK